MKVLKGALVVTRNSKITAVYDLLLRNTLERLGVTVLKEAISWASFKTRRFAEQKEMPKLIAIRAAVRNGQISLEFTGLTEEMRFYTKPQK